MRSRSHHKLRAVFFAALSLGLFACGDSSAPRPIPTSIEITTQPSGSPSAGLPLATSPAFVVKDRDGNPISGVPVTVTVSAGGGSLVNAPTKTSAPSTLVGTWTLGHSIGLNSLTIAVSGVTSAVVSVTSFAGSPARIVATTPTNLTGVVGQPIGGPIAASLQDAFGNAISGVELTVTVGGGGSSISTVTTDGAGTATIPVWTLGTVKGTQTLTLSLGSTSVVFSAAAAAGPIQSLNILSGNNQSGLPGTPLAQQPVIAPVDQYGNTLDNQVANFNVLSGSGTLSAVTAASSSDGTIAMPNLTMGRSAGPQSVLASIAPKSVILNATASSDYTIDVRFWGSPMTPDQQALFTNAAARIRGVVVGSIPTVDGTGADPSVCGVTGVPVLSENIPGVIIYASVQSIDGPGKILAQAGPCFTRQNDLRTAVGVMEFDVDDITTLAAGGNLQDVITHEMLHVVGVGTFWNADGLLAGYNTFGVVYTGAGGIRGCLETGGTNSCVTAVPVENVGGPGTVNSHWRESVFGPELMTGYANSGPMPLSILTVRSIGDLNYTINPAAADPYSIFVGSIRANPILSALTPPGSVWERGLSSPPRALPSHARTARGRQK
jgi:hypothetical protein